MRTAILFLALLLAFAAPFATAQEKQTMAEWRGTWPEVAPVGEYKPLTLWYTIALSSSYYTNPQHAQSIDIAYSFSSPELATPEKNAALWELAKKGKVSFATFDPQTKSFNAMDLNGFSAKYNVQNQNDLRAALAKNVFILSNEKVLLGEQSKATVWKAGLNGFRTYGSEYTTGR